MPRRRKRGWPRARKLQRSIWRRRSWRRATNLRVYERAIAGPLKALGGVSRKENSGFTLLLPEGGGPVHNKQHFQHFAEAINQSSEARGILSSGVESPPRERRVEWATSWRSCP